MAKVTRYLKLKHRVSGEVVKVKLGVVKITDVASGRYTIYEKGDDFNAIIEQYGTNTGGRLDSGVFEVVGTKNYFSVLRTAGKLANEYRYSVTYKLFYKGNTTEVSNGSFWSDSMLRPMFCYEENLGLVFPITIYDMYKKTDRLLLNSEFYPYTPPSEGYYTSDSWWVSDCGGKSSRTSYNELITAMRNNKIPSLATTTNIIYNLLKNYDDDPVNGNPNENPIDSEYSFPGKPTSPQGGNGAMNDTNDSVLLATPDVSNVSYPVRAYRLSRENITQVRDYLWSTNFLDNIPKLFSDPFDAIVGMQAIPYMTPANEGNIIIGTLDTGIVSNKVDYYYYTVDLGTVSLTEYWENFLDYQPYTKLKLYLPYIGIVDLPTDVFMNDIVSVKYRIDIVSGACVAVVENATNIICTFTGNCCTKIPLSSNDHSNAIGNSLVGIAGLAGSIAVGNAVGAVANTASMIAGLKERIQISGSLNTSHGILINDTPFLMVERPTSDIPQDFAKLKGYTSNITTTIENCNGYTEIAYIDLKGIGALKEEIEMLESILKEGFYA